MISMQDFAAKRDALFACLDDASKDLKGTALDQSAADKRSAINALKRSSSTLADNTQEVELMYRRCSNRRSLLHSPDRSLSHLRGKESMFKKPGLPIGRCLKPRKTPDYQINPHKWKKYSLSDVDISDHTNTAAAFAFLQQMDEKRETQLELSLDNAAAAEGKIEFKKSSKIRRNLKAKEVLDVPDAEIDKPKMRGSKLMMPEYVVGQKQEKTRKMLKPQGAERAAGKLTLAHLQAPDEDEIEEG